MIMHLSKDPGVHEPTRTYPFANPGAGDQAVLIVCPSCRHSIRVVDLRPGRFTPRCPRCERVFQLSVPEERGRSPVITPLDASVFAEPVLPRSVSEQAVELSEFEWPVLHIDPSPASFRPHRLPRGAPRLLARHMLLRLLGEGPRGRAFLARPLSLGPCDVLKLGEPSRWVDRVFRAWFTREAFSAAQLEHPNIVAIRELGNERGLHHATVEYVNGLSLAELLRDQQRLEPFQAAVVILQAARGLNAAHAQGLWHRDVKPQNIRLDSAGLVKVDDLGLEMTPSLASVLEARRKPGSGDTAGQSSVASISRERNDRRPTHWLRHWPAPPLSCHRNRLSIQSRSTDGLTFMHSEVPFTRGDWPASVSRRYGRRPDPPAPGRASDTRGRICFLVASVALRHHQDHAGQAARGRYPSMAVVVDVLEAAIGLNAEPAMAPLKEASVAMEQAVSTLEASPARQLRFRILCLVLAIWTGFVWLLFTLGVGSAARGLLGLGAVTGLAMFISSIFNHRIDIVNLAAAAVLGGGVRTMVDRRNDDAVGRHALHLGRIIFLVRTLLCGRRGGRLPSFSGPAGSTRAR